MRFSACALQARADALEGNLFKMCSWGGRITRYWIKYCSYASSAEAVKIRINKAKRTNCGKFNLIAPLARFIPELTRFSALLAMVGAIRRGAGCPSAEQPVMKKRLFSRAEDLHRRPVNNADDLLELGGTAQPAGSLSGRGPHRSFALARFIWIAALAATIRACRRSSAISARCSGFRRASCFPSSLI